MKQTNGDGIKVITEGMLYTLILRGLLKEATFDVNEGKSQLCKKYFRQVNNQCKG